MTQTQTPTPYIDAFARKVFRLRQLQKRLKKSYSDRSTPVAQRKLLIIQVSELESEIDFELDLLLSGAQQSSLF